MKRKVNKLSHARPVWIRSPKSGVDYWCGMSRSKLYQLEKDGEIRSASLRKPGQTKATKLWELQSIFDYIERCERN